MMKKTILLVDDSKTERVVLQAYLHADYELLEAECGEDAIELLKLKSNEISAIVMDVIMPGIGGFETLKLIKTNPDWLQIPILIATGLDDEESREKAIVYGADNFVTKPFNRQLLLHLIHNAIQLRETSALANALRRDSLTGLLNRESFFTEMERMLARHADGYYMLSCVDVENFKVVNDQYGTEVGDEVLKSIAGYLNGFAMNHHGLSCRYMADQFAILFPAKTKDTQEIVACVEAMTHPSCLLRPIRIRIGRYLVIDRDLPANTIYDRASMAGRSLKGRADVFRAEYTESMRETLLFEQQIVTEMLPALQNGEFEPWFQPQYNHSNGALIGAEALIRWRKNGRIVPPNHFIPIFERNGFIYEVDQFIWRQVCICLRRWLDEGKKPLPISVNISRYDINQDGFLNTICELVKEYDLPAELLRLEVTESVFADTTHSISKKVTELINCGFTVEIDDFGSGYSSLNTLKDIPASILKLDMRFFENTINSQRGGNITESVVRMSRWLGMVVIAEGVENTAQADYLKSIGCNYIQGYLYARPMPLADYESLLSDTPQEPKLTYLQTLDSLNQNEFWNPQSMDTLIFNSYAGAACILEFFQGKVEMTRVNDNYVQMLGSSALAVADLLSLDWAAHMDSRNLCLLSDAVMESHETKSAVKVQLEFRALPGCAETIYLYSNLRVIATAGDRYLVYCLDENITAQRNAEKKSAEDASTLNEVLCNVTCGISAVVSDHIRTKFVFVNDAFFRLMGYSKEQYEAEVKMPYDIIHPDDRATVRQNMAELMSGGGLHTLEYRIYKRDRTIIWIQNTISSIHIDSVSAPVYLSVFTDISEQRETARLKQAIANQMKIIMENINGGITATVFRDKDNVELIFANDGFYQLYGYTREQLEAEVPNMLDLILPEDREKTMEIMARFIRRMEAILTLCTKRATKHFIV